jgi:UDPglucose--hexose-1-phosphate uridylyltransferase
MRSPHRLPDANGASGRDETEDITPTGAIQEGRPGWRICDAVAVPELRIDPLSGHRTIVAGERSRRPGGEPRTKPADPIDPASDPFAEGHEDRTPPELYALRNGGSAPNSPGWRVRVVPNLYPALSPPDSDGARTPGATVAAEELPKGRGGTPQELFIALPATGGHEVIVNGPESVTSLAELPREQVVDAVETWRERMRAHEQSPYVQLIVNERVEAGASLPHTHAQLYALDFVPNEVARERERSSAYTTRTMGGSLVGDVVAEEVRRGERVVAIDQEAVLIAPWASRLPFQLMLAPRTPRPRFEQGGPSGASLLHEGLCRLARHLGSSPPLNMWVRTAPRGSEDFCWRIDVLPRLTHLAGLELSTGLSLNIVSPEQAAAALREA